MVTPNRNPIQLKFPNYMTSMQWYSSFHAYLAHFGLKKGKKVEFRIFGISKELCDEISVFLVCILKSQSMSDVVTDQHDCGFFRIDFFVQKLPDFTDISARKE